VNAACPTGCADLVGSVRGWVCRDCGTPIERYRSPAAAIEAMRTRLRRPPAEPVTRPGRHWCTSCAQPENPDGAYRVCPGCGHVWASEDDLIASDLDLQRTGLRAAVDVALTHGAHDVIGQATAVEHGDQVLSCPMCGHPF
jgi:hypothetical protein